MSHTRFPLPPGNSSLPLTFHPSSTSLSTILIIGTNKLAASRCFTFMDAGAKVVVAGNNPLDSNEICEELKWRIGQDQIQYKQLPQELFQDFISEQTTDVIVSQWVSFFQSIPNLLLLTVTDTLSLPSTFPSSEPRSFQSCKSISLAALSLHLPLNITDLPLLSTYTFPSTHRFPNNTSTGHNGMSGLQISVTTGGRGCRLGGRIKRLVVGKLGGERGEVGVAVDNMGLLRERVREREREKVRERGRSLSPDGKDLSNGMGLSQRRTSSCKRLRLDNPSNTTPNKVSFNIHDNTFPNIHQNYTKKPRSTFNFNFVPSDDDDTTLFTSGPLNSPVPQLNTPSLSRTNTPALSRTNSSYFSPVKTGSETSSLNDKIESSSFSSTNDTETPTIIDSTSLTQQTHTQEDDPMRRLRWISQISEYWSMEYLAKMSGEEMEKVLEMWEVGNGLGGVGGGVMVKASGGQGGENGNGRALSGTPGGSNSNALNGVNGYGQSESGSFGPPTAPRHDLALSFPAPPPSLTTKQGKILLVGSGPGHPDLLTVAALKALSTATLILSDKLVPSEVLALIPKETELHIAKKFPGNAEGAQNEMMDLALEGAKRGEVVVRLKQGDPFVYGRGGEEVLFFRENGFECTVIPGVSSALAGPLMMGVPVTQRGVAESMVLCTGVGRKGKAVQLPGYVRSRSLVVLMGVARINQVLQVLLRSGNSPITDIETQGWRDGAAFPPYLPIAIIERASSHDQRMVASTLENIEDALERSGEQRPPGMMIIGWAVLALEGQGDVTVLDDDENDAGAEEKDRKRVERWLGGREYVLKDGLGPEWRAMAEEVVGGPV